MVIVREAVLHLGVEDAGIGLHHAHSAIEGLEGEEVALTVRQDACNVETKILGVHLRGKAVADGVLRLGRNLDAITRSSQVANNLAVLAQIPQTGAEDVESDRVGLIIGERNQGLGWVAIDELDTKDLRLGESSVHLDGEIRGDSFDGLVILHAEQESRSVN